MKINNFGKFFMHNSLRVWYQKKFEIPKLFQNIRLNKNARILEIGCGRGVGAKLIQGYFNCEVIGIDIDKDMIKKAKKYLSEYPNKHISFQVANASKLPFKDNSFDAVFGFWVLHHVKDWKRAIDEIYRVLKPEGYFSGEEIYTNFPFKIKLSQEQLKEQLKKEGFKLLVYKKYKLLPGVYFTVIKPK